MENENMLRAIKRAGWRRSALNVIGSIVAILVGLWALGRNINSSVEDAIEHSATDVFEQKIEQERPDLLKEVDDRIRVHKLESDAEFLKVQGETNSKLSELAATQRQILERLPR
jgi:hypothetical protein